MFWLYPAIASYFFFSITSVISRLLLSGPLPNAGAYAFTIAAAGITVVVLMPFGFSIPEGRVIVVALLAGIISIVAFASLYHAIRIGAVSRVVPTVGAIVPLVTLGLTALIAPSEFIISGKMLTAIVCLILGSIFLTIRRDSERSKTARANEFGLAAATALLFAASIVMNKFIYQHTGFINGLIWVNFGSFLMVPILLLFSNVRKVVLAPNTWRQRRVLLPLAMEKSAGALGSLLQQYAIFLVPYGQLALMNALQGVQYFFIIVIVLLLALWRPNILREELTHRVLPFRIAGIIAIAFGLYAMAS